MSEKSSSDGGIELSYIGYVVLMVYSSFSSAFVCQKIWEWFVEKPTAIHLEYDQAFCLMLTLAWLFKSRTVCIENPKTTREVVSYVIDVWIIFGICALWHFTTFAQ